MVLKWGKVSLFFYYIYSLAFAAISYYFLAYEKVRLHSNSQKLYAVLFVLGVFAGFIMYYFTLTSLIAIATSYDLLFSIMLIIFISLVHVLLIYVAINAGIFKPKRYIPYYGISFSTGIAFVEGGSLLYIILPYTFSYLYIVALLFAGSFTMIISTSGYVIGKLVKSYKLMQSIYYPVFIISVFMLVSLPLFLKIYLLAIPSAISEMFLALMFIILSKRY
ncbi:MAG: hypothetical protein ACP5RS_00955 [Thermoplasmata archaeon]